MTSVSIEDLDLKKKYRCFRFTTFNLDNDEMTKFPDSSIPDALPCKFIIYGKELCPSNGRPHLQGYLTLNHATTVRSVVKKLNPKDKAATTYTKVFSSQLPYRAMDYCTKDGDFTARGEPPIAPVDKGKGEKRRWSEILSNSRSGNHTAIPDEIRFKFKRCIDAHRRDALLEQSPRDTNATMLWFHGAPGTGKSWLARNTYPDAYLKSCSKWWDGYNNEDAVIIEDFDKNHEKVAHHLKIWADRYPFPAEIKGGQMKIRPSIIIVTSNYHPDEIWEDSGSLGPILRRFKLHDFQTPWVPPASKYHKPPMGPLPVPSPAIGDETILPGMPSAHVSTFLPPYSDPPKEPPVKKIKTGFAFEYFDKQNNPLV